MAGANASAVPAPRRIPWNLAFGGGIVLTVIAVALVSLVWTPGDPYTVIVPKRFQPPSPAHWLGTDRLGRDVLSMLMVGAWNSLSVALVAVTIGMAFGVPLGLAAAAAHDWRDLLITRLNDLVFAFPALLLAIMITALIGPGAVNAMIAIGIFNVPVFARVARGAALPVWTRDFVSAARVAGKGAFRISLEHVLPNVLNTLVVQATVQFSVAVLAEAALSYFGLGAQPPAPTWGRMLADAATLTEMAPLLAIVPGITIVLTVLGLNLAGDGLRDLIDPRLRRSR
jgi:peptide/nickel transport system permease protein